MLEKTPKKNEKKHKKTFVRMGTGFIFAAAKTGIVLVILRGSFFIEIVG